jgi:hypothetical protein
MDVTGVSTVLRVAVADVPAAAGSVAVAAIAAFFGRVCLFNQLISDVIFVYVTHISRWFPAYPRCCQSLYIVEPHIRVKLFRLRFAAQGVDFAWPRVYAAKANRLRFCSSNATSLEIVTHQLCRVFGAAMDVGFSLVNVADAENAAGFGMNCIRPTAPTRLWALWSRQPMQDVVARLREVIASEQSHCAISGTPAFKRKSHRKGKCPDRVPSTFEAAHRMADAINAVAATTVLVLLSETVSEVVP